MSSFLFKNLLNGNSYAGAWNQLVIASGVSRSLIRKYESGEKSINKAAAITLYQIAKVLNYKIEDFLELWEGFHPLKPLLGKRT